VFVNQELLPFTDQWAFLSSIQKMTPDEVKGIFIADQDDYEIIGVRAVILDETENEPWKLTPSRKYKEPTINGPLPDQLNLVISNQIYIEKEGLPAP
jgi:hypothetical protein